MEALGTGDWILIAMGGTLLVAIVVGMLVYNTGNTTPLVSTNGSQPTPNAPKKRTNWKGMGKGAWNALVVILRIALVLGAFYLAYLLVSTVWEEITNPAGIYESSSRSERDTASRPSLGEKCPKLSRGEHHTCGVKTATDWTFFETGPQVEGYQVSILPDYDLDRQRPEAERAYRELHFLLDDGTSFRYEGKPPPRMAVAFRAVVNRPTEFIYKMEPVR